MPLQSIPGIVFSQQLLSEMSIAFDTPPEQDLQTMQSFLLYKLEVGAFGAKPYVQASVADMKQLGTSTAAVVLILGDGVCGSVPLMDAKHAL